MSHGNVAVQTTASNAKSLAFPVLQNNQDVYSTLDVHELEIYWLVWSTKLEIECSTLLILGVLSTYIDMAGKKVDKAVEMEAEHMSACCKWC